MPLLNLGLHSLDLRDPESVVVALAVRIHVGLGVLENAHALLLHLAL